MDVGQLAMTVGVMSGGCSALFAFLGYQAGIKKENVNIGQESGSLKADIEYIKRRTDDVLLEQRGINNTLNAHSERLARVEESSKQAHKRLDEISSNGI